MIALAHIKAAIKRITHPTDRFLVAEQMFLLTIKQHSTEQLRDFLVRINNQAALCELTKLAADPVQETTELVFLAGLADPHLKLKLLDHIQVKDSTSVTDSVSLASITGLQRTFALLEEKSPQTIFNASDSCHQQCREMKTTMCTQHPIHRRFWLVWSHQSFLQN